MPAHRSTSAIICPGQRTAALTVADSALVPCFLTPPNLPSTPPRSLPDFLPETAAVRADPGWKCAPPAPGLVDRRVEITGPVDRKMVINALNSGATQYMADFEGAWPDTAGTPDADRLVVVVWQRGWHTATRTCVALESGPLALPEAASQGAEDPHHSPALKHPSRTHIPPVRRLARAHVGRQPGGAGEHA